MATGREMPSIVASTYTTTYVPSFGDSVTGGSVGDINWLRQNSTWDANPAEPEDPFRQLKMRANAPQQRRVQAFLKATNNEEESVADKTTRRIVQVFIADPDENVPLADSVLYTGEQTLTDLTDQELFFEVNIKDVLDKHNEKRTKIVNKKVKDRTEYLEAARIRDLKMAVVTVAKF